MNTVIDLYDYTNGRDKDAPEAWENYRFGTTPPLPNAGEIIYLCADPESLAPTELQPYRVRSREFYISRDDITQEPMMRVCLNVERFEEREYS